MDVENADRFNGKSEVYNRSRPGYPAELLEKLIAETALDRNGNIAEIGAGTGLFTECLVHAGFRHVSAVEPNAEFRSCLCGRFSGDSRVTVFDGSAEHTGLPDHRFDLITAAQAFHWFDKSAFRTECLRIARSPETVVALIWNNRRDDGSGFHAECRNVCAKYCPKFTGFSCPCPEEKLADFFRENRCRTIGVPNDLVYPDAESFAGRMLSSSYAPLPGSESFGPFVNACREIFGRFQRNGELVFPMTAYCYYGQL